jgi:hypothetical protein
MKTGEWMKVLQAIGFSKRAAKALIEDAALRAVIEVQAMIQLKPSKAKKRGKAAATD